MQPPSGFVFKPGMLNPVEKQQRCQTYNITWQTPICFVYLLRISMLKSPYILYHISKPAFTLTAKDLTCPIALKVGITES